MINRSIKTVLCAAASLGALAVASMPAEAGGFALREQSTVGQGMSFAGVAAGGALSSMFWNPATLGAVQGIQSEQNFTLIVPITEVTAYSVLAPTTPIDQGDIDYPDVVKALLEINYAGWCAAEVGGGDVEHLKGVANAMDHAFGLVS